MAQALQEPVPVLPEAVAVRSEPEYRPCPHCGHQLEVQLYVRRFKVPSLPLGFLPSHNCRLRGCLECDPKEGSSGHRVCRGSGAETPIE